MATEFFATAVTAGALLEKDYRTIEKRLQPDAILVELDKNVPLYRIDPLNERVLSKDATRIAHNKVRKAIETGELIKQPCEVCGRTKNVVAHHDDYSKPLEVRWLCGDHHRLHHKELRKEV